MPICFWRSLSQDAQWGVCLGRLCCPCHLPNFLSWAPRLRSAEPWAEQPWPCVSYLWQKTPFLISPCLLTYLLVSGSREGLKCSPNFNRMLWMGSPFPTLGSLSGAGHSSTSCRVSLVVSESPDFIWESFFFLTGTWRTEWDSFYPWSLFWLLRPTLEW